MRAYFLCFFKSILIVCYNSIETKVKKGCELLNTLEFISSIIKSIAWPVVVLIIVILLRRAITGRLSGLTKITYNNLEMDFEQKIEELESKIEESEISDVETVEVDNQLQKIKTVAEVSPNAAVTMAWSQVEQELKSTIMRLSISPDYPPYNSFRKNLILLKEHELINHSTENTILELMKLRNTAVHAHPNEKGISFLDAIKYYELSTKVISILKNI
jgi:hypothetical protein